MLRRVEFKNYRCLRAATLQLSPLTVLVGPNASGKSSALSGLEVVAGVRQIQPSDAWRHEQQAAPMIQFMGDEHVEASYSMGGGLSRLRKGPTHQYKVQVLSLELNALRSPNTVMEGTTLQVHGRNLTNVFATLDRARQQDVVQVFCKLVPVFSDIHAKPAYEGHHQLRFRDAFRSDVWYEPMEVSDGTMLILAFLLTQYQTPQVDVLAIEEPERGLHPYLLGSLMKFLRGMAHGEVGSKPVQIVLATHSASLLDHAKPEEVRFFQRAADGSVTIESAPTGDATWSEYYSNYQEALGQAWLSGGLGGVPGG